MRGEVHAPARGARFPRGRAARAPRARDARSAASARPTRRSPVVPGLRADDAGVATAIGAILLIVIVFVALVVVQTSFVPRWEEQAEADHARVAQNEMLRMLTEMQRRADNSTQSAVSLGLTMDDGRNFLFAGGAELPGSVGLASGSGLLVTADELRILSRDGRSFAVVDEAWTPISSATTVTDVSRLDHLRIRVYDPEGGNQGDAVRLEVVDGNGALAGRMLVYKDEYPSGWALRIQVTNPAGDIIVDTGESRFQQDQPPVMWVNALEPEYLFPTLLAAAPGPLTTHFQELGLTGDFTMQGLLTSGTPLASGGTLVTDFAEQSVGGRLTVDHRNQRFPDQAYAIDHGAIVLVQPDGATFLVPPDFKFGTLGASATASLRWSDVAVAGTGQTITSQQPVHVTMAATQTSDVFATAPGATLRIDTPWPALWQTWLDDKAAAAGWSSASGHYTITVGPDWVSLAVAGPLSDDTHDLTLEWRHATIFSTLST